MMNTPFPFANAPCMGLTLQRFVQPLVMSQLSEEPIHGYLLMKKLEAMPFWKDAVPDKAGVYRLLHAMEGHGLVASHLEEGKTRERQTFVLTALGKVCLQQWEKTLAGYAQNIAAVLTLLHEANAPLATSPRGTF